MNDLAQHELPINTNQILLCRYCYAFNANNRKIYLNTPPRYRSNITKAHLKMVTKHKTDTIKESLTVYYIRIKA